MDKISIIKIITNTFLEPWNNKQIYTQALAIPVLLLVCIWGIWLALSPQSQLINALFYGIYFIAFAYLAISCHKLVLYDRKDIKSILISSPRTLLRFLVFMVVVYLLATIMEWLIITIYINVVNNPIHGELTDELIIKNRERMDQELEVAQYLAYIPSMYILARFCLVFPAVALGYKPRLKWSWGATKENHLRILFIVAIFPWALHLILYTLYRNNATTIEQTIVAMLTYMAAALGVIAISLTYKELQRIEQQKL